MRNSFYPEDKKFQAIYSQLTRKKGNLYGLKYPVKYTISELGDGEFRFLRGKEISDEKLFNEALRKLRNSKGSQAKMKHSSR